MQDIEKIKTMKHLKTFEDLTKYSVMPLAYDASAELDELENENSEILPFDEYVVYMNHLKVLIKRSSQSNFFINTNKLYEYRKKYPFISEKEPYKSVYLDLIKICENKHDELSS